MLQLGVNTEPPSVEVGKRVPVPEIICDVNEDKDKIRENIKSNIQLNLPQVRPYETQWEKVVGIVLGGPTLKETFPDLLEKAKKWDASNYC
jgi:predicted phage-related endonuclease